MELTKQDRKNIEEETRKLINGIKIEASEYARLYEITFLEKLKEQIDYHISITKDIVDSIKLK